MSTPRGLLASISRSLRRLARLGDVAGMRTYVRGDAVTWGGSLWIAQKETSAKPDSPESGFRLAVKKGRDGKDAK